MKLDQNRLKFLDRVMQDWGLFLRDGHATPGMFSGSQWPDGRPVKMKRHKKSEQDRLIARTQPHSTRERASSKALTYKVEYKLERVHAAVLRLSPDVKEVVCCLYLRGMCFKDICQFLDVTSRYVGEKKHKALIRIDTVV